MHLEKVLKEVGESRARVEEIRVDKKRKRLEDIWEEELRNDRTQRDEAMKEELKRDAEVLEKVKDSGAEGVTETAVVGNETADLRRMFKNINANDAIIEADRVEHILAAIADSSTIDPHVLAGDEPRDWEDSQRRPPAESGRPLSRMKSNHSQIWASINSSQDWKSLRTLKSVAAKPS